MPDPEFTPTVDQAKRAYVTGMRQAFIASAGEHAEEFARFLAARDASVRAAALDEAAEVAVRYAKAPTRFGRERIIAGDIEHRIRALKEEKK